MEMPRFLPRRASLIVFVTVALSLETPVASLLSYASDNLQASSLEGGPDDDEEVTPEMRIAAEQRLEWRDSTCQQIDNKGLMHVQVLSINDFHGQISAGRRVMDRPAGGAAVLASYLASAQIDPTDPGLDERTLIVHAGDQVGASPPASALLQDEPSISFFNLLANRYCLSNDVERSRLWGDDDATDDRYDRRLHPSCNLVGTLGNHEFDEGKHELLRLLNGGNYPGGPFLENSYRGARYPTISSNVVDAQTGKLIVPPFVIKIVQGVPIAFIGAVLKQTPTMVTPTGVASLQFLDEADSINRYVRWLRQIADIRTFIVLIHQGGTQEPYQGPTQPGGRINGKGIVNIVSRLDDEVDVVVSGHAHAFTNALLKNQNGKDILITQAFSSSTAYGDIDLTINRWTRDVVAKSAAIVTTFADAGPGLTPVQ